MIWEGIDTSAPCGDCGCKAVDHLDEGGSWIRCWCGCPQFFHVKEKAS